MLGHAAERNIEWFHSAQSRSSLVQHHQKGCCGREPRVACNLGLYEGYISEKLGIKRIWSELTESNSEEILRLHRTVIGTPKKRYYF